MPLVLVAATVLAHVAIRAERLDVASLVVIAAPIAMMNYENAGLNFTAALARPQFAAHQQERADLGAGGEASALERVGCTSSISTWPSAVSRRGFTSRRASIPTSAMLAAFRDPPLVFDLAVASVGTEARSLCACLGDQKHNPAHLAGARELLAVRLPLAGARAISERLRPMLLHSHRNSAEQAGERNATS